MKRLKLKLVGGLVITIIFCFCFCLCLGIGCLPETYALSLTGYSLGDSQVKRIDGDSPKFTPVKVQALAATTPSTDSSVTPTTSALTLMPMPQPKIDEEIIPQGTEQPFAEGIAPTLEKKINVNVYSLINVVRDENLGLEARKTALEDLGKIVRDVEVNFWIKQMALNFLVKIPADKNLHIDIRTEALSVLGDIARDTNVSDTTKQKAIDSLMGMATDNRLDIDIRFEALWVLGDIAEDAKVSDAIKQKVINSLINIARDKSLDTDIRAKALWVLGNIVRYANVSASIKEEMVEPLLEIATDKSLYAGIRFEALWVLGNIALDPNVSASIKEEMVESLLGIATDKSLDTDIRTEVLLGLGNIAGDANVSASIKEEMVEPLLEIATDKNSEIVIRGHTLGILLGHIANNPQVDASLKTYLKERIAAEVVSETNRIFWDEFGVLVLKENGEFTEEERDMVYNVLSSLSTAIKMPTASVILLQPNLYFYVDFSGIYYPGTTLIGIVENRPDVLFHERAHYLDFKQLSPAQLSERDRLWEASEYIDDFARDYGMTDKYEDLATMFEAYTWDTLAILASAKSIADSGRDVLLQKVQFITGIFAHTKELPGGESVTCTYVFKVNEYATITLKEVALTEQEINNKKYLLPDFNVVYNEVTFSGLPTEAVIP